MKKQAIAAAVIALAATPAFSQLRQAEFTPDTTEVVEYCADRHKVVTNGFWSNWFISAGVGPQVYFGDHDNDAKFGNRISPSLDINVGKWFSPEIGVRFGYNGLSAKGATQYGNLAHGTGEEVPGKGGYGYWLQKQKFNYFNFHLEAMFNLCNIIGGYKEKRIYSCIPYAGVGVMKVTDEPKHTGLTGHFGILNSFRVSPAIDINLDLRGTLVGDQFDGEVGGRSSEGMFAATVGVTYKFKQRGWERGKTVTRTIYNTDELNALRDEINRLSRENARLNEELAKGNKTPQTVVKQIASANLVVFTIGSSELSNQARANLGMLAEVIKRGDKGTVYTVTGYADAGTGSKAINERLSRERAEAVRDCPVDEFGVDASQLEVDYKGGVDNMFYDDPRLSRAVITRSN